MTLVESVIRTFSDNLGKALLSEVAEAKAKIDAIAAKAEDDIARCRMMSKAQVREALNCSMRKVDNLMNDGSLPVVWLDRRPRFDPDDVRALCQRRKLRESAGRARRAA